MQKIAVTPEEVMELLLSKKSFDVEIDTKRLLCVKALKEGYWEEIDPTRDDLEEFLEEASHVMVVWGREKKEGETWIGNYQGKEAKRYRVVLKEREVNMSACLGSYEE